MRRHVVAALLAKVSEPGFDAASENGRRNALTIGRKQCGVEETGGWSG